MISERPCPLSWVLAAHPAQLADHPQVTLALQQWRLGTHMEGPARDPGLGQLPFLHGQCWLGAAAPSLGALCLDLPSCLTFLIC